MFEITKAQDDDVIDMLGHVENFCSKFTLPQQKAFFKFVSIHGGGKALQEYFNENGQYGKASLRSSILELQEAMKDI